MDSQSGKGVICDLVKCLETGEFSDIEFEVGPDRTIVKAHKMILKARSPVFVTMLEKRWSGNSKNIKLPEHRLEPFKEFLRFVYSDEIDETTYFIDDLFELMQLGNMYYIPRLVEKVALLLNKIMKQDVSLAWTIYDFTHSLFPPLAEKAFQLCESNILRVLQRDDLKDFEGTSLVKILNSENIDIQEIELFNAVSRWVGKDDLKKDFAKQELVPLIRFPLMKVKEFGDTVVPSGLLSEKQIIHLFLFFTDDKRERFNLETLGYKFRSRKHFVAKSSTELQMFLKQALPGDVIQLIEGIHYTANVKFTQDFITLKGVGEKLPINIRGRVEYGNTKCVTVKDIVFETSQGYDTELTDINPFNAGIVNKRIRNINT